jgi:hypothetical protein
MANLYRFEWNSANSDGRQSGRVAGQIRLLLEDKLYSVALKFNG